MEKDNTVFMCMSCGKCERKEGTDSYNFVFRCKQGGFAIDSLFASKVETIGCRSWVPADDNYWEPYIFIVDEKHKEVKIGKWGKTFTKIDVDEFRNIADALNYDSEDPFNQIIEFCEGEFVN